jgi:hypothetical protein
MKCPDCTRTLVDVATVCRCGWRKGEESDPQRGERILEATYARLDAEALESSRRFLAEQGLTRRSDESLEAWRARTKEWMKGRGLKKFGGQHETR